MYNQEMIDREEKKSVVILGEWQYALNKSKSSKSKFTCVGLLKDYDFKPIIILRGNKGEFLKFDGTEWKDLISYQGAITNYLYSNNKVDTVHSWTFSIVDISDRFCIKFHTSSRFYITSFDLVYNKTDSTSFHPVYAGSCSLVL